jgi:hypothetical protein
MGRDGAVRQDSTARLTSGHDGGGEAQQESRSEDRDHARVIQTLCASDGRLPVRDGGGQCCELI